MKMNINNHWARLSMREVRSAGIVTE